MTNTEQPLNNLASIQILGIPLVPVLEALEVSRVLVELSLVEPGLDAAVSQICLNNCSAVHLVEAVAPDSERACEATTLKHH